MVPCWGDEEVLITKVELIAFKLNYTLFVTQNYSRQEFTTDELNIA